ncbi:MAG: regulatory protein RecX [Bacteroidota bacterium]
MPYRPEFAGNGPRKSYPEDIVWQKICKWCAFQERSQQEVRDKIGGFGLDSRAADAMIVRLIEERFLSEERFAVAYAGGKFRQLGWGRIRIRSALKTKGVSESCIRIALGAIPEAEYVRKLREVIAKRSRQEREKDPRKRNWKLASYAMSRGFEPDLVNDCIREQPDD